MYVVIIGINTLSRRLVDRLEGRHDVVVVDEDEDKCKRLYSSTGATVINKSPTTLSALEDAGITSADALIATLKDDNQNMVVSSLGKKYGVPKVIARLEDDEYFEAFQIIGAETIGHTDILLSEFLSAVEHPYLVKLANLSNGRQILKASIEEDSRLVDKSVGAIKEEDTFPEEFEIVSVIQDEETYVGELNLKVEEGTELVLIGPEEEKGRLDHFFQNQ
ncbi:MAG: TrkA family potassium uptake protein [Candidatus Nanohaloarchaea archaeon]